MSASYYCDFCGARIPEEVMARRKKSAKAHFCNREHRQEWDKQQGHFKAMSVAGRSARSEAVTKSNSAHPRRKRNVVQ